MITVDISNIWGEVSLPDLLRLEKEIFHAHMLLTDRNGPGNDFLGWLDLPVEKETEEIARIRAAAERCLKLLHNHDVASKEDIELLNSAFQEFLAAKFRLIPGTITFSDIQCKATALDGQKLETLRKFLEICENARYAGGSVSLDEIRQPLSQILRKS